MSLQKKPKWDSGENVGEFSKRKAIKEATGLAIMAGLPPSEEFSRLAEKYANDEISLQDFSRIIDSKYPYEQENNA